ncbi:kinase-interacting family protein [Mercurialis annua]|uniref:kinase-interacting family protein n=1 Tax=Mercurialis annua TaxID=3986 RepID=UPI0021606F97|nr:kinase-interacting family protein [Mercurialis annua]
MAREIEERMKMLLQAEEEMGDTFAERAEWFFKKRPQLLELVGDLYNGYTSLQDRCNTPSRHSEIVAHLVLKNVEEEVMKHEVSEMSRKIELLKKLLEVLECERLLVLNENSRLFRQNEELGSEAMFFKNKASRLAGCVLQMREVHEAQVYALEKMNKELYQQLIMMKNKSDTSSSSSTCSRRRSNLKNVGLMGCFQLEIVKKNDYTPNRITPNWWAKMKKTITPTYSFSSASSLHSTN